MSDPYGSPLELTPDELAQLPHDNRAPELLASIWALAGVATVFLGLRLYCRLLKRRSLWWDDVILIASWCCMMVVTAVLTYMTTLGFGTHIWDISLANQEKLMLPTNIVATFSIIATVWCKTSFGLTLLQITDDGLIRKITWFCLVSMNVAVFLSALFVWINCTPIEKTWNYFMEGTCWDPNVVMHYNTFASVYSAFTDIMLALLPWKFLWGLQMKRSEKIGVGLAMSMGVFAGITAIVKTTKLPSILSNDITEAIPLWVWGNAEVCTSIIAASIPMLRVLLRDVKTSGPYHSSGGGYYDKETGNVVTGKSGRFVTITSRAAPGASPAANSGVELNELGRDDRSDRSILGNKLQALRGKKGIVQLTDISVKYDEDGGSSREEGVDP